MQSKQKPLYLGHRERLRQKFLAGKIMDYELLELALSFAIPRRDVRPVSRELMNKYGGLFPILTASVESLAETPGMGRNSAIFIKTIHKMMECGFKNCIETRKVFHSYTELANYCLLKLGGKGVEEFHVLYLSKDLRLLKEELHTIGTVDKSDVYPRQIVKKAAELEARSVAVMHNHPTPGMSFSKTDIEMTQKLKNLLTQLDIEFYDHFLVSGNIVYSARNLLLLR